MLRHILIMTDRLHVAYFVSIQILRAKTFFGVISSIEQVGRMRLLTRLLASISVAAALVYGQNDAGGGAAPGHQIVDDGNGQKSVPLRTHSLYPPYLDSDLQSRWFVNVCMSLTLGGNLVEILLWMQISS